MSTDKETIDGVDVMLRVLAEQQLQISKHDEERKRLFQLVDRMGKRMARQRRHVAALIEIIVRKNGGTRRDRRFKGDR